MLPSSLVHTVVWAFRPGRSAGSLLTRHHVNVTLGSPVVYLQDELFATAFGFCRAVREIELGRGVEEKVAE